MNKKLPTINIQGKEYVTVAQRVLEFNDRCPNGSISTEVEFDGAMVRVRAVVTPDVSVPARQFVAHSEEDRTDGNINKKSAVENAETSAVGRALGMMGIGIIEGIASADEIGKAQGRKEFVLDAHAPRKDCATCGKTFNPKASWAKDCPACYVAKKNGSAPELPTVTPEDPAGQPF